MKKKNIYRFSKVFLLFFVLNFVFVLYSCDNSTGSNRFPVTISIPNTIEELGLIATKFYKSANSDVFEAKIDDGYIVVNLLQYGTAVITLNDERGNLAIIVLILNLSFEGNYYHEYFYKQIMKAVDIDIFNGIWFGVFEDGYLSEEIQFESGEFTIKKNNNYFYKGKYYATENRLYFVRKQLWDDAIWKDMEDKTDSKKYHLEENRLVITELDIDYVYNKIN